MSSKAERKRELEKKAWRVPCSRCGAGAGEPCRTPAGDAAKMHRERLRESAYLPRPS